MNYTVMSYNIKHLSLDPVAAAQVIQEAAPDVVALQEPPKWWRGRAQTRAFARQTGMICVATGGWPGNSGSTALFVSTELAPRVKKVIKRGLPWRLTWLLPKFPSRRGFCAVDLGDLVVFSVHLSLNERERREHRNIIMHAAQKLGPERCIIAGDLNESPGGPTWLALGQKLHDAALTSQQDGRERGTFPARKPKRRIDAIFVGAHFSMQNYRVWSTLLTARASDHLPITVEVGTRAPKDAPK